MNENYDALFSKEDKLEPYKWGEQECYTATIDTTEGTNIVGIADDAGGSFLGYYKALDKDGNPIKLVNATGELISYSIEFDGSGKPTFKEDSNGTWHFDLSAINQGDIEYATEIECISFQDLKAILNGKMIQLNIQH